MAIQDFTAGQVLTAVQMDNLQANDYNQTVSTKTASYTLVAADKGTRVVMNSASATTITVNTSLFSAGDTLILQNISTGVCTVTAGTATVSTAGSLAIPQNGSGVLYFTSAGVSIFYPSAGASGTKIGQVVSTNLPTTFSTASTSYTDITGLSVSITPTLNTSKVFVIVNFYGSLSGLIFSGYRLMRDSTAINIGDAASARTRASAAYIDQGSATVGPISLNFLDSPATTSATTYKMQMLVSSGTGYVNRTGEDADSAGRPRLAANITVMEVLA